MHIQTCDNFSSFFYYICLLSAYVPHFLPLLLLSSSTFLQLRFFTTEIAIYVCIALMKLYCNLNANYHSSPNNILANCLAGPAKHTFTLVDRVYCTPRQLQQAAAAASSSSSVCGFSTGYSGSSNATASVRARAPVCDECLVASVS